MLKYKNRIFRKISKGINIVYLTTAILWGGAAVDFGLQRKDTKDQYKNNQISHEEYIEKGLEFTKQEELVFETLGMAFVATFILDIMVDKIFLRDEKER